jgi:hypothetical protein
VLLFALTAAIALTFVYAFRADLRELYRGGH